MTDKKVKKLYQIENNQHLQKAIDNNKNIILLVGHFTSMIFIGRILAQNFYLAVVYKQQKNLLFNHIMRKQYSKHGAILVEAKNAKGIVKTMKNGMPVWYPHDQDLGKEVSVFAPFFNIQTATISATARLAKMTNSVVIPIDFYRDNDIYKIKIQPAIKDYPNDDMVKSATITNEILQKQILNAPEQYLWIHRRFKTRPNDEEYFY
jgi:lauroyl/myristoyl acyltransferase